MVVTGANRTVGFNIALCLAQRGHTVVLLCRDRVSAEAAALKIRAATGNKNILIRVADLEDLQSILRFTQSFLDNSNDDDLKGRTISALVNNAGLIGRNSVRVNHLGHMALTLGLLPFLSRAAAAKEFGIGFGAQVVTVASVAHVTQVSNLGTRLKSIMSGDRQPYGAWEEYADSKAANILFARALARRVDKLGIRSVAVHPGVMLTDLWRPTGSHPPPSPLGDHDSSEDISGFSSARMVLFACVKHPKCSAAGISPRPYDEPAARP